jgi:hypothetical protein
LPTTTTAEIKPNARTDWKGQRKGLERAEEGIGKGRRKERGGKEHCTAAAEIKPNAIFRYRYL